MTAYTGGQIKRIKMQNFMTYDDVELFPKKGLNLIVGLNGSGKSSIMCAICLGLAGKPHFTGRATQLSDFIKYGCHEADIEIELDSVSKGNVVIHRKLKGERSEWTLDNSPSNQNEVANFVKEFNIDTNNLCQFLPQEKVVEFSRMDKKQRLENMLQAIGEPHLFKLFNELKDLYKRVSDLEQTVKKHENSKYTEEKENEKISDEVQKQESRVRLKKKLDELEKLKKIMICQDMYDEVNVLKGKREEIQREAEDLRKKRDEAIAQEDSISNSYKTCRSKFQQSDSRKKSNIKRRNTIKDVLIKFKEQVETAKIEYKNKLKEKEEQQKRLHDLNKQIEGLQKLLSEELQNQNEYNEQEKIKSKALAELQTEISKLYESMEKLSGEKNHVEYILTNVRNQLSSMQNEQNKKMANLKRVCKYSYQAACWLLENRTQFNSNVYLPIMLEINIKSQNNAKYVENVISFRDMIAFVCEDKRDCEHLTEVLKKQQNLPVNIVMAPDIPMSRFQSPNLSQQHRECGLECFIIDLFNAPEPIMKYLCTCCGIHNTPVTTSVIHGSEFELILQSYSTFFSENMKISGKQSRYGNQNWSVKKDFISDKNLLINSNDELQRNVEQTCRNFESELEEKKQKLDVFKVRLDEKEKIQEKLRQEKKFFQDKKKNIENLKAKYLQKSKFQQQLNPIMDEEREKNKMTRKITSINELSERVLCELNILLRDFIELEKEAVTMIMCMNVYSKGLKQCRSANEDIREKVNAVETQLQNVIREHRGKKRQVQQLVKQLKLLGVEDGEIEGTMNSLTQNTSKNSDGDEDMEQPNPVGMTMDEIEHKINHIQAQLNLNEDNESLVNQYNERKGKIVKIQQKIKNFQENVRSLRQVIQEKKKEWLKPLQHHINNINRKFSHYFKELNCVGEISLDIPENPDEFTKYGLRINLKFHDEESSLCELSQTRHSGGECSVAAIIFILSLQELTEVPFRCIDEINQGMDSVNERKIYKLIYDTVSKDKSSQYFLLTPKLLMDLDYPEDAAIHIIMNSPFLGVKLDVQEHLKIAQSTIMNKK